VRPYNAFERAAADHRDAIETVIRSVAAIDTGRWRQSARPGKWSAAEIAHHLILAYEPPLSELSGGAGFAVRLPWWKRRLLRWRVLPGLLAGTFPPGAPAPKEIRPRGEAPGPEEAVARLRESARHFEARLAEAHAIGTVRLTHAYFGKLNAPQTLKLLAVHAKHHAGQFRAAAGMEEER